jgi:radical SAM superfamily enzyme YgiQ (UPF0313 family)/protein-L-isoaspartate O-methyltransferase
MTVGTSARTPAVLLLSPGILKWTDVDFGLPHLVALGSYLQAHLPVRVEIVDLGYEGGDHRQLAARLQERGPFALVGVSAYSSYDHLRVLALARFLRRLWPDVPLVAGGYHASAVPEELLGEGGPFDAVVVGEGELPLRDAVARLLGGGERPRGVLGPAHVPVLDDLPPYDWTLLRRYWPRARELGRKLQVYLSRGCPYDCTFCMERAKRAGGGDRAKRAGGEDRAKRAGGEDRAKRAGGGDGGDRRGDRWRAYAPERALDELRRLARHTDLAAWIVNVADPLFGLNRAWRRAVLEGILREGLQPRQFWTLTRTDDLDEDDVRLLARARFSIGLGLESGAPDMLRTMQKTARPERYLGAVERLAGWSRQHGLNWAANLIVGHPGETPATMAETEAFVRRLFLEGAETRGWLSIDPFRLYPGSHVHAHRAAWEREQGARFHHPRWWAGWYDAAFRAEHVDPSAALGYEERVRRTYAAYGPLVRAVVGRFRGQGRDVDGVFARSLAEQVRLMGDAERDRLLARAAAARRRAAEGGGDEVARALPLPIGLHVRDPWVRRREEAVRRLLEAGVLRSEALIEALLETAPEQWLGEDAAAALLADRPAAPAREGAPPGHVGLRPLVLGLEALGAGAGEQACDALATTGYVAALLAAQVGEEGRVTALVPAGATVDVGALRGTLARPAAGAAPVDVVAGRATTPDGLERRVDALWLGAALPRRPAWLMERLVEGGRAVLFLGPRFRAQDLVCVERRGAELTERVLGRARAAVVAGPQGWLRGEP